jgi:hypothetical protein
MSLDQKEVLTNLITQRNELENTIAKLQSELEKSKTQYLKICGAIDVLSQIEEANNPPVETTEEEE